MIELEMEEVWKLGFVVWVVCVGEKHVFCVSGQREFMNFISAQGIQCNKGNLTSARIHLCAIQSVKIMTILWFNTYLYMNRYIHIYSKLYIFSVFVYIIVFLECSNNFVGFFFHMNNFDIGISLYILRFEIICRWVYVVLIMKIIAFSSLHYLKSMPLSDSVWYCIRRFLFIKG